MSYLIRTIKKVNNSVMSIKSNDSILMYGDFVKGTCMTMCPEKERLLRERENLLHRLEKSEKSTIKDGSGRRGRNNRLSKADPDRTVKCFSRSAAGHKTPHPSDLRPAPILKKTVTYLLSMIAADCTNDAPWVERYQFVADRLRAVRQDMVIQNLPPSDSIEILEPIVRFHCYSSYRLCEEPIDNFDPKLNSTHLQECLKRLLVLYDCVKQSSGEEAIKSLKNQSEIEVLYLTVNLGDVTAIRRALERNSVNKLEQLALQLSLAWLCGNYVRVGRLVDRLPTLPLCAVASQLPTLRRQALCVMTTAFSSKNLKVPLAYLKTTLKWSDTGKASQDCTHYGVEITTENGETYVSFLKGTFKSAALQVGPRKERWIEDILRTSNFSEIMFPST